MFEIESKQSQIRHEVNEANVKYGYNFEIKEDILCESVVIKLRKDLSDAQRVTVEKMEAQRVIFEAEQALARLTASSVCCKYEMVLWQCA